MKTFLFFTLLSLPVFANNLINYKNHNMDNDLNDLVIKKISNECSPLLKKRELIVRDFEEGRIDPEETIYITFENTSLEISIEYGYFETYIEFINTVDCLNKPSKL